MQSGNSVFDKAMALSPHDQAELADKLLDKLDAPDAEIDALWAAEAEARLDAYELGELKSVSLGEIVQRYRSSKRGT